MSLRLLAGHYRRLLSSRAFLGYALGGGCATTSVFAFVAAAPFIYIDELHRPAWEIGLYLGIAVSGVSIGSLLASRLLGRIRIETFLVRANWVSVIAAFVLLGAVLAGLLHVWLVVGLSLLYAIGVGAASPAALTQAVSVNPAVIGSAAGLYGAAQMLIGAICTALAALGGNPALAAALVLAGAGLVAQAAFAVALRR